MQCRHLSTAANKQLAELIEAGRVDYLYATNPTGRPGGERHVLVLREADGSVIELKLSTSEFRERIAELAHEPVQALAVKLGQEHGTDAGAWLVDGNTTEAVAREMARRSDDGEFWRVFGPTGGVLSGEFTSEALLRELGYADPGAVPEAVVEDLCTRYVAAFLDAFEREGVRAAEALLGVDDR